MAGMTGSQAYALSKRFTKKAIEGGITPSENPGFDYEQTTPSATWTIVHSLGTKYPCVTCLDEDGNTIFGEIDYYSENATIIRFSVPVKGTAHLNSGGGGGSGGGGSETPHIVLDQADYDALVVKNPNTVYLIKG